MPLRQPIQKKRVWADYEQLFRVDFSCFGGQNLFKKYFSNHIEKFHKMFFIISFFLKKKLKNQVFLGLILRFSNLNVLHKGLLLQDWVFRLGA